MVALPKPLGAQTINGLRTMKPLPREDLHGKELYWISKDNTTANNTIVCMNRRTGGDVGFLIQGEALRVYHPLQGRDNPLEPPILDCWGQQSSGKKVVGKTIRRCGWLCCSICCKNLRPKQKRKDFVKSFSFLLPPPKRT